MATALAQDKPKGKVTFRLLFRNLEKSKINTRGQNQALMKLSVNLIASPGRCHEAGFRQTLADAARWYENKRRFLDMDILGQGLTYLNEVFTSYGYPAIPDITDCPDQSEAHDLHIMNIDAQGMYSMMGKAEQLINKNRPADALSLLKTLESMCKRFCESKLSNYSNTPWGAYLELKAHCYFRLEIYPSAIEDYSQSLALLEKGPPSKDPEICNIEDESKPSRQQHMLMKRGISYHYIGYHEEAKSDLKIALKNLPARIYDEELEAFFSLCGSFLYLRRFKHALLAAYQNRFYAKKVGKSGNYPSNQYLLTKCLYEDKKFQEAQWLCPDLISGDCDDEIKAAAVELNGYCLMEMKKYGEAMINLFQATELISCPSDRMRICFAMYKYACDAQVMALLPAIQSQILPWSEVSYKLFPKLLMERGRIENAVKFVIENSAQEVKSKRSREAKNHLRFCNSVMISMKFRK